MKLITSHKNYWFLVDEGLQPHAEITIIDDHQPIIAHIPLNNAPVLKGVLLLPEVEPSIKDLAKQNSILLNGCEVYAFQVGFEQGYIAAPQKKWTDEDMKKAIELASEGSIYTDEETSEPYFVNSYNPDEILQSLSPVPIGFEPEYEAGCLNYVGNGGDKCQEPCDNMFCAPTGKFKTIKTDKGEVLQGKYIFTQ